jgi:T5SS/PEP-CTERM-associated repeat protein
LNYLADAAIDLPHTIQPHNNPFPMKKTVLLSTATFSLFLLTALSSKAQDLYVGSNTPNNSLSLTNGGQTTYQNTYIGYTSDSSNNSLTVANPDTQLSNSNSCFIGYLGSGNNLTISNGGSVSDSYGLFGSGTDIISSNNSVLVTGNNSTWVTQNWLALGYSGGSDSMVISDGGSVTGTSGSIGWDTNSGNNSVFVNGTGSVWNNLDNLVVGSGGPNGTAGGDNTLLITNGGEVICGNISGDNTSAIGAFPNQSNNSVVVTGVGSKWIIHTGLSLGGVPYWAFEGSGSSGNSLIVSSAGFVSAVNTSIGMFAISSNNAVTVTGSNSIFTNSGVLTVGDAGSGTLVVANGGSVLSAGGIVIANQSGSSGTLNIGSLGGSDTAGTLNSSSISFGSGTGTINFNNGDVTTVSSTISGNGSVNQLGSGTTILTGNNSYTGTTTVSAGTLLANNNSGSAVGTSTLTIQSGGTIGGNGTISGGTSIASGGNLTAGSSGTGSLSFTAGLTLSSGATTSFLLNSTNSFTSINLIGNSVNYGGALTFNITSYTPAVGDAFTVFNMTGGASESGDFSSVEVGSTFLTDVDGLWIGTNAGVTYQFSDSTGQLTVELVPEPSTYALFGLGIVVTLAVVRRKRFY